MTLSVPPINRLPQYRNTTIEERARDYLINGVSYARVTSALGVINKPGLVGWAKTVTLDKARETLTAHYEQMREGGFDFDDIDRLIREMKDKPDPAAIAAQLGSEAHSVIHRLLEGDTTAAEDIAKELRSAVVGASQFLRDRNIQPRQTEFTVWDEKLKVAGTIDCVGYTQDGTIAIIDWKRSKGIYPETALQLSAYARLFELTTAYAVKEAWVVRLPQAPPSPDGEPYEACQVADIAESYRTYRLAAALQAALKADPWRT